MAFGIIIIVVLAWADILYLNWQHHLEDERGWTEKWIKKLKHHYLTLVQLQEYIFKYT